MTAITDRIAAEHVFRWIEDRPNHGPFATMLPGCACGIALDRGFTDHAAHIAAVTEAAVREQVARDILAQRERYSCTGLEDAAYDDAAWIARGGA